MGRNRDQKVRRKNAPGVKREADREAAQAARSKNDAPAASQVDPLEQSLGTCPTCGATDGEPCRTKSGKKAQKAHSKRISK